MTQAQAEAANRLSTAHREAETAAEQDRTRHKHETDALNEKIASLEAELLQATMVSWHAVYMRFTSPPNKFLY
jgi:hypothetical protein